MFFLYFLRMDRAAALLPATGLLGPQSRASYDQDRRRAAVDGSILRALSKCPPRERPEGGALSFRFADSRSV